MHSTVRKLTNTTAILGAALLIAAGCGDDGKSSSGSSSSKQETTMSSHGGSDDAKAGATVSPAADLRITLDRLMGEHAMLAQFATQKGLRGDKDFEAIAGALDENSVELSEAIGSVYGEEAGTQFLDGNLLWRDHIGFFVDYTTALAKKDTAGQKKAGNDLRGYAAAFSGFLSKATGLPQDVLQTEVSTHVTHLKGQLDAYNAGNYEKAYKDERHAYEHMIRTADTLSGAIAEQKSDQFGTGDTTQSAVDLRAKLGTLLGEHLYLAALATHKGYDGDPDFKQIAAALDANSVALSEVIGAAYGDEAAKQFLDGNLLWRDHIGFFVDYTTALAKKDKAGQQKAVENLTGYAAAFSNFLSGATGLPQDVLQESITSHVMHLKEQIDAYAAGDYKTTYAKMREGYEHMYMTGDTLAAAIVDQNPEKFSK
jgi:hypothetical protein